MADIKTDGSYDKTYYAGTLGRFWAKCSRSGDCLLWTASVDKDGYGDAGRRSSACLIFRLTGENKAHRVAYVLYTGFPIPPTMQVLHRCDNPKCIDENHLWPGTHTDNHQDKKIKGRGRGAERGEDNTNAKLTESDVRKIRDWHSSGKFNTVEIAKIMRVKRPTISLIVNHKNWKWVK